MENDRCLRLGKAMLAGLLLLTDIAGANCDKPPEPLLDLSRVVVEFKVKFMGFMTVSGQFHNVRGNYIESAAGTGSALDITVCINSVDTQNDGRDRLLRSAAFFDVERFPTIEFTGVRLIEGSDGTRYLSGNLTLHGVSQAVRFSVTEPEYRNPDSAGRPTAYSATASINRSEFGLDAFRMLVSDDVEITVRVDDRFADVPQQVFSGLSGYDPMPSLQYQ